MAPESPSVGTTDFRAGLSDTTYNYHSCGTLNYLAILKDPAINPGSLSNAHEIPTRLIYSLMALLETPHSHQASKMAKRFGKEASQCVNWKILQEAELAHTSIFILSCWSLVLSPPHGHLKGWRKSLQLFTHSWGSRSGTWCMQTGFSISTT